MKGDEDLVLHQYDTIHNVQVVSDCPVWEKTWEQQRQEDELTRQLSVVNRQLGEESDETKRRELLPGSSIDLE